MDLEKRYTDGDGDIYDKIPTMTHYYKNDAKGKLMVKKIKDLYNIKTAKEITNFIEYNKKIAETDSDMSDITDSEEERKITQIEKASGMKYADMMKEIEETAKKEGTTADEVFKKMIYGKETSSEESSEEIEVIDDYGYKQLQTLIATSGDNPRNHRKYTEDKDRFTDYYLEDVAPLSITLDPKKIHQLYPRSFVRQYPEGQTDRERDPEGKYDPNYKPLEIRQLYSIANDNRRYRDMMGDEDYLAHQKERLNEVEQMLEIETLEEVNKERGRGLRTQIKQNIEGWNEYMNNKQFLYTIYSGNEEDKKDRYVVGMGQKDMKLTEEGHQRAIEIRGLIDLGLNELIKKPYIPKVYEGGEVGDGGYVIEIDKPAKTGEGVFSSDVVSKRNNAFHSKLTELRKSKGVDYSDDIKKGVLNPVEVEDNLRTFMRDTYESRPNYRWDGSYKGRGDRGSRYSKLSQMFLHSGMPDAFLFTDGDLQYLDKTIDKLGLKKPDWSPPDKLSMEELYSVVEGWEEIYEILNGENDTGENYIEKTSLGGRKYINHKGQQKLKAKEKLAKEGLKLTNEDWNNYWDTGDWDSAMDIDVSRGLKVKKDIWDEGGELKEVKAEILVDMEILNDKEEQMREWRNPERPYPSLIRQRLKSDKKRSGVEKEEDISVSKIDKLNIAGTDIRNPKWGALSSAKYHPSNTRYLVGKEPLLLDKKLYDSDMVSLRSMRRWKSNPSGRLRRALADEKAKGIQRPMPAKLSAHKMREVKDPLKLTAKEKWKSAVEELKLKGEITTPSGRAEEKKKRVARLKDEGDPKFVWKKEGHKGYEWKDDRYVAKKAEKRWVKEKEEMKATKEIKLTKEIEEGMKELEEGERAERDEKRLEDEEKQKVLREQIDALPDEEIESDEGEIESDEGEIESDEGGSSSSSF